MVNREIIGGKAERTKEEVWHLWSRKSKCCHFPPLERWAKELGLGLLYKT